MNRKTPEVQANVHLPTLTSVDGKLLLTVEEAARQMAVSRAFVYQLLREDDTLPVVRMGRTVRIPALALGQWLARKQESWSESVVQVPAIGSRDPHAAPLADALRVDDTEGWRMLEALARDLRNWHRMRGLDGRELSAEDLASVAGRSSADAETIALVLVRIGLIDAVAHGYVPRDEPLSRLYQRIRTRKSRESAASSQPITPDSELVTPGNSSSPSDTDGDAWSRSATCSRVTNRGQQACAAHSTTTTPMTPITADVTDRQIRNLCRRGGFVATAPVIEEFREWLSIFPLETIGAAVDIAGKSVRRWDHAAGTLRNWQDEMTTVGAPANIVPIDRTRVSSLGQ